MDPSWDIMSLGLPLTFLNTKAVAPASPRGSRERRTPTRHGVPPAARPATPAAPAAQVGFHATKHGDLEVKHQIGDGSCWYLGGGFKYFHFHPYLGKIPILTNIFEMGWNHQLDTLVGIRNALYRMKWPHKYSAKKSCQIYFTVNKEDSRPGCQRVIFGENDYLLPYPNALPCDWNIYLLSHHIFQPFMDPDIFRSSQGGAFFEVSR